MSEQQAQPEAVEAQHQEQPTEQSFGIFEPDTPSPATEVKPDPEPVVEQQPDKKEPDARYEEVSKLTADMLEMKRQNQELRKLLEGEKDEAADELEILNDIFGDENVEKSEAAIEVARLKKELADFRESQQQTLQELKTAQHAGWAQGEVKEIAATAKALSSDLPWVDVAMRVNPRYADAVLDDASAVFQSTGQKPSYSEIIRSSDSDVKDQFMSLLDSMLSVPAAKAAVLEKLGVGIEDKQDDPAKPAVESKPSPTLDGSVSVLEPSAVEFENEDEAFDAAVKMLEEKGFLKE
jgi:hypothetical protein